MNDLEMTGGGNPTYVEANQAMPQSFEFSPQELTTFKQDLVKTFDVLATSMKGLADETALACTKIHNLLSTEQSSETLQEMQIKVIEVFMVVTMEFLIDTFPSGGMVVQFDQLNEEQRQTLTDRLTRTAVQITKRPQMANTVQLDDPV